MGVPSRFYGVCGVSAVTVNAPVSGNGQPRARVMAPRNGRERLPLCVEGVAMAVALQFSLDLDRR